MPYASTAGWNGTYTLRRTYASQHGSKRAQHGRRATRITHTHTHTHTHNAVGDWQVAAAAAEAAPAHAGYALYPSAQVAYGGYGRENGVATHVAFGATCSNSALLLDAQLASWRHTAPSLLWPVPQSCHCGERVEWKAMRSSPLLRPAGGLKNKQLLSQLCGPALHANRPLAAATEPS